MNVHPTVLIGKHVRLEPMTREHAPALFAVSEPSIWRFMNYGEIATLAQLTAWVEDILSRMSSGTDLPYVVILHEGEKVIGATRYLDIRPAHRAVEIGGTWYGLDYQRTFVNTECKYLMLKHAFEQLGCIRVQFKADARNASSLRAIERIGAVREGTLRNHMILPDGYIRDSVYFSILDREWPSVKLKLEGLLK